MLIESSTSISKVTSHAKQDEWTLDRALIRRRELQLCLPPVRPDVQSGYLLFFHFNLFSLCTRKIEFQYRVLNVLRIFGVYVKKKKNMPGVVMGFSGNRRVIGDSLWDPAYFIGSFLEIFIVFDFWSNSFFLYFSKIHPDICTHNFLYQFSVVMINLDFA